MSINNKILCRLVIVICFWQGLPHARAGDWSKIKTITLESSILTVSLDRYNLFYIADDKGNITKYDTTGTLQFTYSPQRKADVTVLEAWRNVNIFVFYRNIQEFLILDRFLAPSPNTAINRNEIGFARLATYAYDNNVWVIDENDFSLKKYSLTYNKIELNTPLDLILDPSLYDMNFMREYQNLVFVNDKNSGILIFDNMGIYKTKIPVKGLNQIGFYNDEIYFQEGGKLKFINIYSYAERTLDLPDTKQYLYILYGGNRLYLFGKNFVEVYMK